MSDQKIRFEDGASYERMMGTWSRLVGIDFLHWLAPRSGLRWIDIGCGNGAFPELLVERCGQPRFTASTRPRASLPSLAAAPLLGSPSFVKGTLWSCHSRTADSTWP